VSPTSTAATRAVITLPDLVRLLTAVEAQATTTAVTVVNVAPAEDPPRYTLTEARRLLLRELCVQWGDGHDLETTTMTTHNGSLAADYVRCTRCGTTFTSEEPTP